MVEISGLNVLHLDLKKFRDAGSSRAQITHDEIPVKAIFGFQFATEKPVICITDDILKEILLLDFDESHFEIRLFDEVEISIQRLKPQVYGLRFVVLNQPSFIRQQVLLGDLPILSMEILHRFAV